VTDVTSTPAALSAGTRLRVVIVTNLYPSARRPGWGSYVASRAEHLRAAGVEVDVLRVNDTSNAVARYGRLAGQALGGVVGGLRGRLPDPFGGLWVPPGAPGRTVVEAHIAYPTGLFAWPLARSINAPLVLFAHGSDVLDAPLRSRADGLLAPRLFAAAELVIANSAFLAEKAAALGVTASRLVVVSPGIDYRTFAGARDAAGANGVLRSGVLYVGHLIPRKGPDLLVDALGDLPAAGRPELTVLGDGPLRLSLWAGAAAAGVAVRWRGAVEPAAVAAAMARAAVVVVPSRMEALGLAALEAMAAGAITVVTQVGGLGGLVDDGRTGFVAASAQRSAIAAAVERALATAEDPDRAGPMRMSADATAAEHAAPLSVARTVELYEDLLARRAGDSPRSS
jgi:glycosyltransferase involved in cell wall biosynthesis